MVHPAKVGHPVDCWTLYIYTVSYENPEIRSFNYKPLNECHGELFIHLDNIYA